jgi:hypothetical protein
LKQKVKILAFSEKKHQKMAFYLWKSQKKIRKSQNFDLIQIKRQNVGFF